MRNLMQLRVLLLTGFLFFKVTNSFTQEYPFTEITSENGLPHSLVFDMFQDSRHYLWFATTNGIGKYDGRQFENYYDSDGLQISQVLAMSQTEDGKIWAATFGGGLYFLENEKFKPYHFPDAGSRPKNIFKIIPGEGNRLYLLDNFTNNITIIENGQIETVDLSKIKGLPVRVRQINNVFNSKGNILWIGTDDGLFKRENNGSISRVFANTLENVPVFDLILDREKNLWIACRGMVLRADSSGNLKSFHLFEEKADYTHITSNTNGIIWVCSDKNEIAGINSRAIADPVIHFSLSTLNGITDMLVDHEQNLWISTYGSGLRCYYNFQVKNYGIEDGLTSNFVHRIFSASDSTIWLSTFKSSSWISYIRNDSIKQFAYQFDKSQNNIFAIAEISSGKLLLALSSNEIISIDRNRKAGFYNHFPALDLSADKKGRLWIGSYNTGNSGISYVEKGETYYVKDDAINNRRINVLKQDLFDNLWIGTDSGLYCYHEKERVSFFSEKEGLAYRTIIDLAFDTENNLWIVTGKGIDFLKSGEKKCTTVASAPRGVRYTSITVDKKNKVWAGSSSGLYYLDREKEQFIPYRKGISGTEILCLTVDLRNRLWVGTARGVSVLLSENESLPAPPVYFTHINMNGKRIPVDTSADWDYSENTIDINFTGISFAGNKQLSYKYKLTGSDNEWKETAIPHLLFSNLPPGDYSLNVIAVLPDGTSSREAAQFKFIIHPPFWMTKWFISSSVFLIIVTIVLLFRWRLSVFKKQAQEKFALQERMINLEQQASAAMMHPHFIFNALNSIQSYISKNDPDAANRFLSRFSKLIRLTLENTYKKQVGLDEELERLELYLALEKSRYQEQFDYKINIEPGIDPHDINIPSLIIQPFVENAIWHGIIPTARKGFIEISIAPHGSDHIRILISDDGIGIDNAAKRTEKSEEHKSLGISLTRERMELLGQSTGKKASITITDRSILSPGSTGTCVEMLIPRL
ncbi:histidine kinase [soil metagenome]